MAKTKNERLVSPRGIAVWPRLNEPDYKFKEEGEFSCRTKFDPADAAYAEFKAKLEKLRDEAFAKFCSENPKKKKTAKVVPVYRDELDDEGDETGMEIINFKMKHKVTAKKTGKVYKLKPTIMNAKRVILDPAPSVGGGSTVRVSFELFPYFNEKDKEFGLSFRLIAVQIIDLVEFGSRSNDRNDFDDEDGYDGEGAAPADDDEDSEDGESDSGDDGDSDF